MASAGLLASASTANQGSVATNATVSLSVSNVRSAKGHVLVCLSANPKFFPDCTKDKAARKMKVATKNAGKIQIGNVAPGTYAIALIHDENSNDKMDMALFLPKEGFGFSRNPKIGMGPPKFKSAQFTVGSEDANYAVKMKYIL